MVSQMIIVSRRSNRSDSAPAGSWRQMAVIACVVPTTPGRPARVRRASADDKNKEVPDWARDQSLEVNDRGRIPAHIIAKYEAENGK